ncbi:unnamed protein product [Aphanomyces euteiches]|uniref:Cation/H+ exchanger transmembrane domain-containing protein n=2 Tax=Aphanomyces euteiches TaxID=100861 RepID=A0A6G0XJQ6_9STRA|nr:hypothetical protein Ae201684_004154 [Aphanomyces euteiches]
METGTGLIVLAVLALLVLISLTLDVYQCTVVSKSGLALLIGGLVGLVMSTEDPAAATSLDFNHSLFFAVLLPPIIYEAGFSVERTTFFRNFGAIVATAIWGTFISACVTGLMLYVASASEWIPQVDWVEAFLFGAVLSAVDPVATLASFQKLHVSPVLFNVVFGESVLNDAVAIALYKAVSRATSLPMLILVVIETFGILVGSICVAMLMTLMGSALFMTIPTLRAFPTYEVLLSMSVSLSTYFVADAFEFSGIVALFFSGILTAHYHFHIMSPVAQLVFHHVLVTAAFVSEILVYIFVGVATALILKGSSPLQYELSWSFVGLTTLSLFVGRFLNVFPLVALTNRFKCNQDTITPRMMIVMWLAGLRGAVAVALVMDWSYIRPDGTDRKALMVTTTLFVVIGTTWIVGGLTGPLVRLCGLVDETSSAPDRTVTPMGRRMSSIDLDVSADGRCAKARVLLHKMWTNFDETYMKPFFGGRRRKSFHDKVSGSLLDHVIASTED